MSTGVERNPVASWERVLRSAITTPGLIHEAYHRFHGYSVRNRLLAMSQCVARGITPGPMATFPEWERLDRHVMRGEKALTLCMPITRSREQDNQDVGEDDAQGDLMTEKRVRRSDNVTRKERPVFFVFRARWFVMAQTDGEEIPPVSVPSWSEDLALAALGIRRVPFDHTDGNVQGYATPDGNVAINPVAALPHKTLFHELAHLLLEHAKDEELPRSVREAEAEGVALLCCEALGLDGTEYARGYLQHWLQNEELTNGMAQRIMRTAQAIIDAGTLSP